MAPVAGPEIEYAARDEGKRDGIGPSHPLAMLDDLAVARGEESSGSANHPRGCLHRGSWQTGAAGGEGDPGERAYKHADHVDAAQHAMDLQVTLPKTRRELQRSGHQSDDAGECMRNKELAVRDDLQTVGVVHGVIGNEKNFRSDEDKQRNKTKRDPENGFESRTAGARREQGGRCH